MRTRRADSKSWTVGSNYPQAESKFAEKDIEGYIAILSELIENISINHGRDSLVFSMHIKR